MKQRNGFDSVSVSGAHVIGVQPCLLWLVLLAVWLLFAGAAVATDIFPTKGMIYNPGGGSTPTNKSTSIFVGARYAFDGSNNMTVSVWSGDSTQLASWVTPGIPGLAQPQQMVTSVGSAVIFNDLIYVFVPVFGATSGGTNIANAYTTYIYTVDPSNYVVNTLGTQLSCFLDTMTGINYPNNPLNVAATVWNGAIMVFGTGLSSNYAQGPSTPMVWSSNDGLNWSAWAWGGNLGGPGLKPGPNYIIHDAITINSDQVIGLQPPSGITGISDTIVLLVVSDIYEVNSKTGANMYALYYDPGTKAFLKKVPLPMPTISTSNPWAVNAVGYFGTLNGNVTANNNCSGAYTWNSGISSVLHVISTLSNGANSTMAHWYQDGSGNFVLDKPCSSQDAIWWAGGGCSYLPTCSVAVAPYYVTTTQDASCKTDLCSKAMLFSPGFELMKFSGSQHTTNNWNIPSDNWMLPGHETPPGQSYAPIQASSFEGIQSPSAATQQTAEVNAAMRATWQIIGVIAGPPPYDGTAFTSNPLDVSSIDFSASKTTSSSQSSTFSTSYSFSNTTKMGPPFARTKVSIQASSGLSVTQASAKSFGSALDTAIGTNTDITLAGQIGWVYASGPNIQPNVYNAHSAEDNSALNYSQTAMTIYGIETGFYEYYLANPGNYISNGDPGFFGLMNGSMSFPLSSSFTDWASQPVWEQGYSDNAHPGSYKVLVGQFASPNYPYPAQFLSTGLQGAASVTQSFTSDKSTVNTTDTQTQTTQGISETLEIPLIPELSSNKGFTRNKTSNIEMIKNTTEMDMTQGWDTESTSGSDIDTGLTFSYYTAGMLSSDKVIPYLLQATSPDAPWVPTGYTGPLPWLLTWVTSGSDTVASATSGPAFGRAPAPDQAGGRITGFAKPNEMMGSTDVVNQNLPRQDSDVSYLNLPREDSYFIKGGKLALVKPYGQAEKIAMTASDFNPTKGVKLNINKTDIPISSNLGNWTLYDGIWYYESNDKSKNNPSVAMTLDFSTGTWDLAVDKAILWWNTEPLNPVVITTLSLNDRYILINRVGHYASIEWMSDLSSVTGHEYGIESIYVTRDYLGKGQMALNGYMPDVIREFGDFSVKMNQAQQDIAHTSSPGFASSLFSKGTVSYADAYSTMKADMTKGTWSCTIDISRFERPYPVAGKDGKVLLELKLGGRPIFSHRITCDYYRMDLYSANQG